MHLQEDAHTAILNFDGHSDRALFGVFDGHSGAAVAKFCAKYFPILLVNSPEYQAGDFEGAFNSIYLEMDEMLRRPEHAEELQRLDEKKPLGSTELTEQGSTFQFVEPGESPPERLYADLLCVLRSMEHTECLYLLSFVSVPQQQCTLEHCSSAPGSPTCWETCVMALSCHLSECDGSWWVVDVSRFLACCLQGL